MAGLGVLKKAKLRKITTPYGKVNYYLANNFVFIARHGPGHDIPPHRINHRANIFALKELGVKFVFSFNSVGSLKKEIKPRTFLVPDDYIDFDTITFFDKEIAHITPEISQKLREILTRILKDLRIKFRDFGIYYQARGPRIETRAEIRMIKNFADVVGMTMAKEATLAKEAGLEYASLCSVDNYAHGIVRGTLDWEKVEKWQKANTKIVEKIIQEILRLTLK